MADIEEKMPAGIWLTLAFVCVEILLIVCIVPNAFIDRAILKEQDWGEAMMGKAASDQLIDDTARIYSTIHLESGLNETVREFFLGGKQTPGWESLERQWGTFIAGRGEAVLKVCYHVYYRSLLLLMWMPYMLVILAPAVLGGYMAWNIKRYNFDHSSPFLNTYSSKIISWVVMALALSFIAPLPIPPMIVPLVVIFLIPIAASLLIGNLPKRL